MTPFTIAPQAPLSMEFSRQEYWSGLLCSSQGDLLDPGIKPASPALKEDSLPSELPSEIIVLQVTGWYSLSLGWKLGDVDSSFDRTLGH